MKIKETCLGIEFASIILRKSKSIFRFFFLLLFLLLSGCKPSQNSKTNSLSTEDHHALESLFSHLLFYEGGAYTLFGSKPISFEVLADVSEEEKQEFLSLSSHPIIKNELNFSENWNVWKRLQNQYPMAQFLLFERASPPFSPAKSSVFLVNVAATSWMLQKHYQKFREAVAQDFDPLDTVFDIQDNQSVFWNKIFSREDLLGILLGYGEENSWWFVKVKAWEEREGDREKNDQRNSFLTFLSTQSPGSNSLSSFDASFPLPCFGCYATAESSDLISKYENERNLIKKAYRRKDIVQVTLDRLTSKDLPIRAHHEYKEKLARELGIEGQLQGR